MRHARKSLNLRSSRAFAGLACCAGLVFFIYCARPLGHTDDWGHLAYGRTIWQLRSLPATEPLLPLAQGMPLVDTAWLSQLIGFGVMSFGGILGLKCLYAALLATCVALLARSSYRNSHNGTFAAYAVLAFLGIAWDSLTVVHTQLAGLVCFVALLARCTDRRAHGSDWLLIPALFAVWANLHVSFMMGLYLLFCFAAGAVLDMLRRTGSLGFTIRNHHVRRSVLLLELAAAAVLLNPYGMGLYVEAVSFGLNPNLRELSEWKPLSLREFGGQALVLAVVVLAMVYRWSPRRVRSWEVLALVGLGVAAMWSSGNLIWWAPVAALLVVQHVCATLRALRHQPFIPAPAPRRVIWTLAMLGVMGVGLAYTPLGKQLLLGKETEFKRAVSDDTPVAAIEYLKANRPQGLVFNVREWGDYLLWAGPPGIEVFINSQVHLVPLDVWQRYQQILDQRGNWEEVLDRFAVNAILLDTRRNAPLVFKLKRQTEVWKLAFEQDGQTVFTRRNPL